MRARAPSRKREGAEIVLRRPRGLASRGDAAEMIVFRDGRVVAAFRDDDELGALLFRLFQLSSDELRCAQVQLDATVIRAQPYVRDVLQAFIEVGTSASVARATRRRAVRVPSFLRRTSHGLQETNARRSTGNAGEALESARKFPSAER